MERSDLLFGDGFAARDLSALETSGTAEVRHCVLILRRLLGEQKHKIFPIAQNQSVLKGSGDEILVNVDVIANCLAHYDADFHASYVNIVAWGFLKPRCLNHFAQKLLECANVAARQRPAEAGSFVLPIDCFRQNNEEVVQPRLSQEEEEVAYAAITDEDSDEDYEVFETPEVDDSAYAEDEQL